MNTADKLMAVLDLFSSEKSNWSVEEAAAEVGLSPSSTYRYFRTLAEADLIVAINAGRYVLGPRIIVLDRMMRLSDPLVLATQSVTGRFDGELDIAGVLLLCRLFREQVVSVYSRQIGEVDLHVSYERGRPMPLFRGASSRVILANLPTRNVRKLFDENEAAFADAQIGATWLEVKRNLRAIRTAGWVVGHGEVDPGVVGIASPIFAADGAIIGSLGFVSNAIEGGAEQAQLGALFQRMTAEIGEAIARIS